MTRAQLLKIAPNSSEGFIAANTSQGDSGGNLAQKNHQYEADHTPPSPKPECKGLKKTNKWTTEEIKKLEQFYSQFYLDLQKFSEALGKTYASVALKASRLGFSGKRGKFNRTKETCAKSGDTFRNMTSEQRSRNAKDWYLKNKHPKGMLGKNHTQATKDAISDKNKGKPVHPDRVMAMLKTKAKNGTMATNKANRSWKSAWREIGGRKIFARSRWEANYARYLQWLKENLKITEWEHEPETFWFEKIKRGVRSYLPDFKVTLLSGSIEFHEVKGWMDSRSKTKIKRLKKYHPTIILIIRDTNWYKENRRQLSAIIKDWET
jgi:hypothetical protein